jgi:hypothetical protein
MNGALLAQNVRSLRGDARAPVADVPLRFKRSLEEWGVFSLWTGEFTST